MILSVSDVKSYCTRVVEVSKSYIVIHKVDILTSLADILVSHPLVVLRRQCQVLADSQQYHLTPVTLLPVVVTLVQRSGCRVLFKGLLSIVVLRAVQLGVEKIVARQTGWPAKLPPTWYINRDWLQHFLLKFTSVVLTSPMYNISVIKTISVSKDVTYNNFCILKKCDFPLTFWQKLIPTAAYRILKYAFTQAVLSFSSAMLYLIHCFDESERAICHTIEGGIAFEDKQEIVLKASVVSYLLGEIVFYPLETVVHRLILQGTQTFTNELDCGSSVVQIFSAHDGFLDCCDNIMWLEGKLGLYKGFGALVMQVFLYHYCIKMASFAWCYIRIYKKTFSQHSSPVNPKNI